MKYCFLWPCQRNLVATRVWFRRAHKASRMLIVLGAAPLNFVRCPHSTIQLAQAPQYYAHPSGSLGSFVRFGLSCASIHAKASGCSSAIRCRIWLRGTAASFASANIRGTLLIAICLRVFSCATLCWTDNPCSAQERTHRDTTLGKRIDAMFTALLDKSYVFSATDMPINGLSTMARMYANFQPRLWPVNSCH